MLVGSQREWEIMCTPPGVSLPTDLFPHLLLLLLLLLHLFVVGCFEYFLIGRVVSAEG